MREFSYIASYVKGANTDDVLQAITAACEAEGMRHVESKPTQHLHHAPALQNNRWRIDVIVGESRWHFLQTTPWNLLAERPDGAQTSRLVSIAHRLGGAAILFCKHDNYPDAYGEVLLEADANGRVVVSGNWYQGVPKNEGRTDNAADSVESDFYGNPLIGREGAVKPRSALLKRIWQEQEAVNWSLPQNDDLRADDSNELMQRYVMKRLLNLSPNEIMLARPDEWPIAWQGVRHFTLGFEWPVGDRPEPPAPQPMPPPDVRYAGGALVTVGDAVLVSNGISLSPGRVAEFLYSHRADGPGFAVSAVVVDTGEPGKLAAWVETIPGVEWQGGNLVKRDVATFDTAKALCIEAMHQSAQEGNPEAQLALAIRLQSGEDTAQDSETSLYWLTQASQQPQTVWGANALVLLATLAVHEDKPLVAIQHYVLAADNGLRLAQFEAGLMYQRGQDSGGKGIARDVAKAARYYNRAIGQGSLAAQYNLHQLSQFNEPMRYVTDDALDAAGLKPLADSGDKIAQWLLGLLLENGLKGASIDIAQAVAYYRLGAAQGHGPCICNLADKLEHGHGVEHDLADAFSLYQQAAAMGVNAASYSLGCMYRDGRGAPQNLDQAKQWLEKALVQGFGDQAQAALDALPNSEFQATQKKAEHARKGAQRMAAHVLSEGNDMPSRDAAYEAASSIHEVDDEEAMKLCLQLYGYAGNLGHGEALHQVAFFHERGQAGLKPDVVAALGLYTRSAELGNLHSQMRLVELYESGSDGVTQNLDTARHWLKQAAKQPHAWEAQYHLGLRSSPNPSRRELGMTVTNADGKDITDALDMESLRNERRNNDTQKRSWTSAQKKPWWKRW